MRYYNTQTGHFQWWNSNLQCLPSSVTGLLLWCSHMYWQRYCMYHFPVVFPAVCNISQWFSQLYTLLPSGLPSSMHHFLVFFPAVYTISQWFYQLYTLFPSGLPSCMHHFPVVFPAVYTISQWFAQLYAPFPSGFPSFMHHFPVVFRDVCTISQWFSWVPGGPPFLTTG